MEKESFQKTSRFLRCRLLTLGSGSGGAEGGCGISFPLAQQRPLDLLKAPHRRALFRRCYPKEVPQFLLWRSS